MADITISGRGHENLAQKLYHYQGDESALDAYAKYSDWADCVQDGVISFSSVDAIREFVAEISDGELPIASCDNCDYMEVGFEYEEIVHFDLMGYRFRGSLDHLCRKCLGEMSGWDFVWNYLI